MTTLIIIAIIIFGVMRGNCLMREVREGKRDGVVWDDDKHTQYIFYGDGSDDFDLF